MEYSDSVIRYIDGKSTQPTCNVQDLQLILLMYELPVVIKQAWSFCYYLIATSVIKRDSVTRFLTSGFFYQTTSFRPLRHGLKHIFAYDLEFAKIFDFKILKKQSLDPVIVIAIGY
jgi:hypothetical protein